MRCCRCSCVNLCQRSQCVCLFRGRVAGRLAAARSSVGPSQPRAGRPAAAAAQTGPAPTVWHCSQTLDQVRHKKSDLNTTVWMIIYHLFFPSFYLFFKFIQYKLCSFLQGVISLVWGHLLVPDGQWQHGRRSPSALWLCPSWCVQCLPACSSGHPKSSGWFTIYFTDSSKTVVNCI